MMKYCLKVSNDDLSYCLRDRDWREILGKHLALSQSVTSIAVAIVSSEQGTATAVLA